MSMCVLQLVEAICLSGFVLLDGAKWSKVYILYNETRDAKLLKEFDKMQLSCDLCDAMKLKDVGKTY